MGFITATPKARSKPAQARLKSGVAASAIFIFLTACTEGQPGLFGGGQDATGFEQSEITETPLDGDGFVDNDGIVDPDVMPIAEDPAVQSIEPEPEKRRGGFFDMFRRKPAAEDGTPVQSRSVKLIERDIEAPDIFQKTEAGLWDGRPSLGGVWVAHPDVDDPERVIIRNETNGKFVIGALFRRERENPGPRIQVSSDAATALSMLAGKPVELSVTALRREEVAQEPESFEATPAPVSAPAAAEPRSADPILSASAAIDAAEAEQSAPPPTQPKPSSLAKPYLQIGIFSVESNAKGAAKQMNAAGLETVIKEQSLKGKIYWRVLVGPAQTSADRGRMLSKIKDKGFADAYAVKN